MSHSLSLERSHQFAIPKIRHRRPPSRARVARFESLEARKLLSTTWYVNSSFTGTSNGSSGAPWTTIQAGINAASNGDTILVETGKGYSETDTINRSLTIEAYAGETPVNQSGTAGSGTGFTIASSVTGWTISGLTIENFGVGIVVDSSGSSTITGNSISGNGYGIQVYGAATIGGTGSGTRNIISNNSNDGIYVDSSATATILGNSIHNESIGIEANGAATIGGTSSIAGNSIMGNGAGIFVGASATILANTITTSSREGILVAGNATIGGTDPAERNDIFVNTLGIEVIAAGRATIVGNDVSDNDEGIAISTGGPSATIGGTTSGAGNTISNNQYDGIIVDSPTMILGNSISNNSEAGVLVNGGATIGGTSTGAGNAISGNSYGIQVDSGGTALILGSSISSNFQGIEVSGGAATIGGTAAGAGDSITGNTNDGIVVANAGVHSGAATVTDDSITGNGNGILVGDNATDTSAVTALDDVLSGNTTAGVTNNQTNPAYAVSATSDWWGSLHGPTTTANPGGNGTSVSANVSFSPWIGVYTPGAGPGFQPTGIALYAVPTQLVFVTEPSTTAIPNQAFTTQPVVEAEDGSGNLGINFDAATVSGVQAVMTLNTISGSGALAGTTVVSPSGGLASFSGLNITASGTYTLTASSSGFGGLSLSGTSTPISVVSTATKLVVHTQPSSTATAGVAFATQPVIYEEDQNGNLETGDNSTVVTVALSSGTGPLRGTTTATVSGGVATFTNLADNTAETISLKFTSGSLTSATSGNIVVSPAAASQLVITTQPSSTATAGQAFATQPVVKEEDAFNNVITTDSTNTVTAARGSTGTASLQGTNLTVTLTNGVATFSGLAYNKAETMNIAFTTSAGGFTAASSNVVVSPTAAAQLVVHTQPSATATVGLAFEIQPVIDEEDKFNNLETGDNSTLVTAALSSGTGPLQGTTAVAVSGGVATFTNLADNTAETISLKFTSGTLTNAASTNIVVSAASITSATIFGNTTPTNPSQPDSHAVELGVKFDSSVAGDITGIRFYKGNGNTGTHVGYLWTNTGSLLAMATFTNETASGWQQVNFTTPVAITAGTVYVASYVAPAGHYADDNNDFASSGVTSGPLTALSNSAAGGNGVYLYGASGGFPTNTYESSNYYVDVVFSSAISTATQLVVHTQPSSTATAGVPFGTQPVIYEEDQNGNLETGDNSTVVTVALGSGAGPLQGTLTATVSGGVATFTNLADNTAETISLKFTSGNLTSATSNNIVVSTSITGATIFGNTTPANPAQNDAHAVELGVKFESSVAGDITGIRFYKGTGNTGTHVGYLWTDTGSLLAMATFTNETASGWQQVNFTTPVAITAGTIDVASYFAPAGHYADDNNDFASSGVTSGPLTALSNGAAGGNGVYLYGVSGSFPTNTYLASNYYVDVVFSSAISTATQLVVHTQPSSTATAGVAFATQPVIYEEDQNGNLETGDNSTVVTVSLESGAGPLQGTLTATVSGGVATFTNLADNTAETISLKFTSGTLTSATSNNIVVSAASSITGATIFGNTTPANPSQADAHAVELGVKFESSVAGDITGIRFYKGSGNTGTHVGYLWTDTGSLLASATFTNETASGWQQVNLSTPVAITAGTVYIASYLAPAGHYADDNNDFASSAVTNGPLTALSNSAAGGNGVYLYGLSGGFPTNSYLASNYYVDVVFSSTLASQVVTNAAAATAGDPIAGIDNVAGVTTNEDGHTAALDAVLAGWTSSDSSTTRISKIMNSVGTGDVEAFRSSTIMPGTNANTVSNGSGQTQNNNLFLALTSLPADKVDKKPGETDTNV